MINLVEEEVNMVVLLKGPVTQTESDQDIGYSFIALEFVNNDKVMYLREGRPLEEKLGKNQMKIYKYINSDPNVEEVRVHLNTISGSLTMEGAIKGEEGTSAGFIRAEVNTLRFKENLTLPIVVVVRTDTRAVYTISMQIVHKSHVTKQANVIPISEDLTHRVQIPPSGSTIFEVTPVFYGFNFHYSASQSVIACAVNFETNRCLNI